MPQHQFMPRRTKLILTVDTECSAGGWPQKPDAKLLGYDDGVLCKIGANEYGIRHIMKLLEQHGLVADFFVEPLCSYKLGIFQLREICQEIIARGHGISLHLHPRWKLALNPALSRLSDSMYDYTVDEQARLISEGLDILSKCGIQNIKAFRAGNLHGDTSTYEAMRKSGISISSNFCGAWNCEMPLRFSLPRDTNDASLLDGIVEIPVTSFHDFPYLRPNHLRPLQVAAASIAEFRNVIRSAVENRLSYVIVLLHTFEWIRFSPNKMPTLDRQIIKRFHGLCRFLHECRDMIDVCTFGSLDAGELRAQFRTDNIVSRNTLLSSDTAGAGRYIFHATRKTFKISRGGW